MPKLNTQLNARSADFQTNATAMRALVDDLAAQIAKVFEAAARQPAPSTWRAANCCRVTVCRCCLTPVRRFLRSHHSPRSTCMATTHRARA